MTGVPEGFARHDRTRPLTAPGESLWFRSADGAPGLRVADAHCNLRGLAYGGFIAALANNATGITCARSRRSRPVTAGLSVDYLRAARIGRGLEFTPTVDKAGATLGVATGRVTDDGSLCARATTTFVLGA